MATSTTSQKVGSDAPGSGAGALCSATRKDGTPCRARARPGGALCFAHAPETAAQRLEVRARGGKNSARAVRLQANLSPDLRHAGQLLRTALDGVFAGEIEPRVATAIGALVGRMIDFERYVEFEHGVQELQERIDVLELQWNAERTIFRRT